MEGEGEGSYLAGRVHDLGGVILALEADYLGEGVLDGRVVALDKVAVDKLDCQGGLACRWEAPALCQHRSPWCPQDSYQSRTHRSDEEGEGYPEVVLTD